MKKVKRILRFLNKELIVVVQLNAERFFFYKKVCCMFPQTGKNNQPTFIFYLKNQHITFFYKRSINSLISDFLCEYFD